MNGISGVQQDVSAFMSTMGQPIRAYPMTIPDDEVRLRIGLIEEEYDETMGALISLLSTNLEGASQGEVVARLAELADGIADLVYVLVGTARSFGIDMTDIWAEVQASNMLKATGPVRQDGKRLKPEGWEPPDVEGIIIEQRAEGGRVMTDLATVLARMDHQITQDGCEGQLADCDVADQFMDQARSLLTTPEGQALAALVEAALAWRDIGWDDPAADADAEQTLLAAIDAYREATR